MNKNYKKPHYIEVKREEDGNTKQRAQAIEAIKNMLQRQSFAVLATNAEHESYTSLISFATNSDATFIAFSTPIDTHKYRMIENDENVSLLIDNRSDNRTDINEIAAITAIGKARILREKDKRTEWAQLLIEKHHYLDDFICAETSALIIVEINKYHYVSSFQEVIEWHPE